MSGEAMPTGRERPGEHWNARLIREEAEAKAKPSVEEIEKQAEYFAVTFDKPQDRASVVRELTRFGCRLVGLPDPDRSGEPPEPTEFGSIIYGRLSLYDSPTLWQRTSGGGWSSEDGAFVGSYQFLRDVTIVQRGATKP